MTGTQSDALVFFGATGDLAYKKIFPALQAMLKRGHPDIPIIGVAKAGWNLDQLRAFNLQPKDLERRGQHPTLGVVTLSQLLATWAAHDLTHLHQISRVMAHQYRDAVGPWSKFLGVLKCNGHSS